MANAFLVELRDGADPLCVVTLAAPLGLKIVSNDPLFGAAFFYMRIKPSAAKHPWNLASGPAADRSALSTLDPH